MKIFIGMVNITSLMDDYATGFRDLGHDVFTVTKTMDPTQSPNVDLPIPLLVEQKLKKHQAPTRELADHYTKLFLDLAWEKALEADICMFIWESFRPDASDLKILKKLGKKIIIRFCGSEVKEPSVTEQASKHSGYPFVPNTLVTDLAKFEHKLRYLRTCEKYADVILGCSDMSLRPFFRPGYLIFNSEDYKCSKEQKVVPALLHAPSKMEVKRTLLWVNAFQGLQTAGLKFSTRIVQGIPNEELPTEYTKADIYCNSLGIGGRSTWEAMASSCVVLDRTDVSVIDSLKSCFEDNMAGMGLEANEENLQLWLEKTGINKSYEETKLIIHVTPENLVEKLASIILDYPKRVKLSKKSYDYIATFSPKKTCQKILDYTKNPNNLDSKMGTIWKPFFSKVFDDSDLPQEKVDLFNKYNELVKNEKWYKNYITPKKDSRIFF